MKSICMFVAAALIGATAASAQGITDAQIASIVVTANQVDIDAGKLAAATSKNADVRTFAQLMVRDHAGVNKQAVDLVTKLKVTPEDNETSRSLKAGGEKNLATLKSLKGAAFDRAYVDHEVTYHQAVLDAVDKTLIPGATNADLKALLVKVRPAFVTHLEHAKHLQASLGQKPHVVTIDGARFSPADLTVKAGETVVWTNTDLLAHTATSKDGRFDSKVIQPGQSWRFVATRKGEYTYACAFHPMSGTLNVQ